MHSRLSQGRHRAVERFAAVFEPLVRRGLIDRRALEDAVRDAYAEGGSPAVVLVERLGVPKRDVGGCLSAFYRCPFVEHGDKFAVPRGVAEGLSPAYLRRHLWMPLWEEAGELHFAAEDPHSAQVLEDAARLFPGKSPRPYVALRPDVLRLIDSLRGEAPEPAMGALLGEGARESEPVFEAEPEAAESDGVVVRLVNRILSDAQREGASDVHVEPYLQRDTVVRFRIDGECRVYQHIPRRYRRALAARLKIMAGLDIAERRRPQDGRAAFKLPGREIELRIATIPTVAGNEDVVVRLLPSGAPAKLEELDLAPQNLHDLKQLLGAPHGLLLCVGPTGSGKTTTLHSALAHLNRLDLKIWTAEDPIEITQPGLRQVQVQPKQGLTFAAALRAFLRADPDVIMVGELRDRETAEIAVQAALTGHLVLSTLHTNGAAETVTRLLDLGVDAYNLAEALSGVLSQRLTRRLCASCRRTRAAAASEAAALARAGWTDPAPIHEAGGCAGCQGSGYKGRVALHELMTVTPRLRELIRARAPVSRLREAVALHSRSLAEDGLLKCAQGLTDPAQLEAVAS